MEARQIEISTNTIIKSLILLGIVWLAFILQDIILLVLVAFILSAAIAPLVERIQKRGVPRAAAILIIYIVMGATTYLFFRSIVPTFIEQINMLSANRQFFLDRASSVFEHTSENFQLNPQEILSEFSRRARDISVSGLLSGALGVFSGLLGFLTILVLIFYFLIDKDGVENALVYYMPANYRRRGLRVYKKISRKMSLWFRSQLALSFTIGIMTYVGLLILGVDYALTLAVVAAFTELIPYIGPLLGSIPALAIALMISPVKALYVLFLYGGIQFAEGHFLTPQLMKKSLGLSPVFTIISILIGARLFGLVGVLLAIPVGAAITVIVEELHDYDRIEEEERKKLEVKSVKNGQNDSGRNKKEKK